jgi:hypothetical protein
VNAFFASGIWMALLQAALLARYGLDLQPSSDAPAFARSAFVVLGVVTGGLFLLGEISRQQNQY